MTEETKPQVISKLKEIQYSLTELCKKQSSLGYRFATNLNLVNAEIDIADKALVISRNALLEKDEHGEIVQYVAKLLTSGEGVDEHLVYDYNNQPIAVVVLDDEGNKRILQKGEQLSHPYTVATQVPDDKIEIWTSIQKEYSELEHDVKWLSIDEEKVRKVAEEEKLEGGLLLPLFGTIIV